MPFFSIFTAFLAKEDILTLIIEIYEKEIIISYAHCLLFCMQ